jgi:hypothetical protein
LARQTENEACKPTEQNEKAAGEMLGELLRWTHAFMTPRKYDAHGSLTVCLRLGDVGV